MHIELLVEDSSGEKLLLSLLPQVLGQPGEPHTWRVHAYKGIGRIPKGLSRADPAKRILLDQLPRLLRGYSKTPGIDAIAVVLDADKRDCKSFLKELKALVAGIGYEAPPVLFRLAIEEMEAWYFGDRAALLKAYPRAKKSVLDSYVQDSACNTWELLADAIYPGGSAAIKKEGWPLPGQVKHEWAERIGPLMTLDQNLSPSFAKLRDGLSGLLA